MKTARVIAASVAALAVSATVGLLVNPGLLLVRLLLLIGIPTELAPKPETAPTVRWLRDYFAIEQLDGDTYAIAEPRYHQKNINHLIVGEKSAVLFDSGPGLEDIAAVVQELTPLPPQLSLSTRRKPDRWGSAP